MIFYTALANLAIFFLLLLVGCGGGGPSGPRSAIGGTGKVTTKPYFCRGEWHYPQNFYEYDQTGLASWYGPGFHGKPKPLGEAFDMHGISAAHRTLPLPTVVKVTNLQTGKSLKLVVDDRGPFTYQGRIIDLSVGAAKALGTYSKGLMTVRVQSVPDESRALSDYLAKHGSSRGKMKDGRTWQQVYNEEIAGKHSSKETVGQTQSAQPVKEVSKSAMAKVDKPLGDLPITIDDVLDGVAPNAAKAAATKAQAAKVPVTFNNYVNLGESYVQKDNAKEVARNLPKSWKASVQSVLHDSGQTFYNVRAGPLNDKLASEVLKQCREQGHKNAIMLKD